MKYSAKEDYQSDETARSYESRSMYSGFVGRNRQRVENNVIAELVERMAPESTVLDCPCGNGRWFQHIANRASKIIGRDISVGQTKVALERATTLKIITDIGVGEADSLDLKDNSIDHVFCYALMKHLPLPLQYKVLQEFSRVATGEIYCSFAVLGHITYARWRLTRQKQSFPVLPEEIEFMADQADLKLVKLVKVSQPIVGMEYFAIFQPATVA